MKVSINWEGGMKFAGAGPSGHQVEMDADPQVGGEDCAIRPMEMIALGLIGCQAMDILSILQKKRENITRFEVNFDGPRSPDFPKVFTRATITFVVAGRNVNETAVTRAIELAATKYCPAQAMLEQAFPIELNYEIFEDEGGGDRHLVRQGVWLNPGMTG
jgi:putative redox protein